MKRCVTRLVERGSEVKLSRRGAIRRTAVAGAGAAAFGIARKASIAQDASPAAGAEVSDPQGPQVDRLLLWTRSAVETSLNEWNALVAATSRYTELVGTPVELETVADDEFHSRLSQAAPAGDGPDVFGPVAHEWIGEFARQQIAMPWEDGGIVGSGDMPQSVIDAVTYEGQVYGLPVFSETLALFYNTDIISRAPTTWDDLVALAIEQTREAEETYGFAFEILQQYFQGAFFHAYGSYVFGIMDGTLDTDDIGLNNAGGVEAAKALRDMFHQDLPPMPDGILDETNVAEFLDDIEKAGQLGMRLNGPWRESTLMDAGLSYGVAPLPTAPNGEPLQPFLGIQVFEVNAYSERIDASRDLVNFLGSQEGVSLMVEGFNKPPVRKSLREAALRVNPNFATYMDQAEIAIPMPNTPELDEVWERWGDAMVGIIRNDLPDEDVQSLLDTTGE